jgi:hypothetical protein
MADGEGGGRRKVPHVLVREGVAGVEHDGGVRVITARAAAHDGLGLEVKGNPCRTVMTDGNHASE